MSEARERLLIEARELLVRPLRCLAGRNDFDEAFAAWLLSSTESGLQIEGPLEEALANGRRTTRGVAILGLAAASQGFAFNHRKILCDSLNWISGRPTTVAGSRAPFTSDPLALLGIALGAHHAKDQSLTSAVSTWLGHFLSNTCSRPSTQPWELCLLAAVRRLVDAPTFVPLPSDDSTADVRFVLRNRSLLPSLHQTASEAEALASLSLMYDPADTLCPAQLALRVAAFDVVKHGVRAANRSPKLTVSDESDEVGDRPPGSSLPSLEGSMSTAVKDRVFISYSWDSTAHQERVVALANALRDNGFTTSVDVFIQGMAPEGLPAWMLNQIRWADYVLCICTENYRKRCEGDEDLGKGKGVKWEGGIITRTLYQREFVNEKFIPVVFEANDTNHIPMILSGATYYNLSLVDGFEALVRHLTNQPTFVANPVGKMPVLPPKDVKPFKPGS